MHSRPSVRISAVPTGRIFAKFGIETAMKILRETLDFAKIGQKYRKLYNNNIFNCKWAVTPWQWLLCMYINMK